MAVKWADFLVLIILFSWWYLRCLVAVSLHLFELLFSEAKLFAVD